MYTEFPDAPVVNIPVSAWVRFFDKQEKKNSKKARVLLLQLRSVMNWCISRQLIPSCEVLKLSVKTIGKKPDVGSRVLTYTELAKSGWRWRTTRSLPQTRCFISCFCFGEPDYQSCVWLPPANSTWMILSGRRQESIPRWVTLSVDRCSVR